MKLNEIVGKEKAKSTSDLITSIKNGKFTKDGSHLIASGMGINAFYLTSLDGCPKKLKGNFWANHNNLTSLKGGPQIVEGDFICYDNKLTSLEGCPEEIGGNFLSYENKITSLQNIHKYLKRIGGTINVDDNPIKSHVLGVLKIPGCTRVALDNKKVEAILNKYLAGSRDIFDCQEELIEANLEEYAQL